MEKKIEIQKQINFIFKDFNWDNGKKIVKDAHSLLKSYEQLKQIKFYDIDEDYTNKKVKIKIKFENDQDMVYLIEDDGK